MSGSKHLPWRQLVGRSASGRRLLVGAQRTFALLLTLGGFGFPAAGPLRPLGRRECVGPRAEWAWKQVFSFSRSFFFLPLAAAAACCRLLSDRSRNERRKWREISLILTLFPFHSERNLRENPIKHDQRGAVPFSAGAPSRKANFSLPQALPTKFHSLVASKICN